MYTSVFYTTCIPLYFPGRRQWQGPVVLIVVLQVIPVCDVIQWGHIKVQQHFTKENGTAAWEEVPHCYFHRLSLKLYGTEGAKWVNDAL